MILADVVTGTPLWIALLAAVLPTAGAVLLWFLTNRSNKRLNKVISGDPTSESDNGILGLLADLQKKVHETEASQKRCEAEKNEQAAKITDLEARVTAAERGKDDAVLKATVFENFIADHLAQGVVITHSSAKEHDSDISQGAGG